MVVNISERRRALEVAKSVLDRMDLHDDSEVTILARQLLLSENRVATITTVMRAQKSTRFVGPVRARVLKIAAGHEDPPALQRG